ncbi:Uncharacterised protein [Pseudomonas fluorescens]|uniref:Uncharacterized protein n=1 Tax=Pseudomonas fluorescens TaxID=294 RepID=A0A3S4P2L5_PSEFL|nr:Uncharacterised protein [Pseudomonas fluorescens]
MNATLTLSRLPTVHCVPLRGRLSYTKPLRVAGARVVEQMHKLSTRTDITSLVDRTKHLIEGQSFGTALYNLANMYPFCSLAESRQAAIGSLRTGILRSPTEAAFLDETGRVIAKRPPLSFGGELTEEDKYTIQAKMVSEHMHFIKVTVREEFCWRLRSFQKRTV